MVGLSQHLTASLLSWKLKALEQSPKSTPSAATHFYLPPFTDQCTHDSITAADRCILGTLKQPEEGEFVKQLLAHSCQSMCC